MTRKGSQVRVLYGPPITDQQLISSPSLRDGFSERGARVRAATRARVTSGLSVGPGGPGSVARLSSALVNNEA